MDSMKINQKLILVGGGELFQIDQVNYSDNIDGGADTQKKYSIEISKTGYTPVAIVGYELLSDSGKRILININRIIEQNNQFYIQTQLQNIGVHNPVIFGITYTILWIKNN